MKNLKTTYWILPLLAANLSMGPEMLRGYQSLSLSSRTPSSEACDIPGRIQRAGQRAQDAKQSTARISVTCDLEAKNQVVINKEKVDVSGKLTVTRVEEIVTVKAQGARFNLDGINSGAKEEPKQEARQEARVYYVATLAMTAGDESLEVIKREYSTAGEIDAAMKNEFKNGVIKLEKRIKQEEAEKLAEKKRQEQIDKCLVKDDGSKTPNANNLTEKLECHKDKMMGMVGREAESYYNTNMKTALESMVFRGNDGERDTANNLLSSLSLTAPPSIKGAVSALQKSAGYQSQIEVLANEVQMTDASGDINGKRLAQIKLQGLRSQMKTDLQRDAMNYSQTMGLQLGIYNQSSRGSADVSRYMQLLNNNMELAFKTPSKFFDTMSTGNQTGSPGYDLDGSGRLQRGGSSMNMSGIPNTNQQNPGYAQMPPRQMSPMSMNGGPSQYNRPGMGPQQMQPMSMQPQRYVPNPVMSTGVRF